MPKILRLPHGYFYGDVVDECPAITTSSWQFNNYLVYVEDISVEETEKRAWQEDEKGI